MMHIGFLTSEYPHPKVKHCAGIGSSLYNLVFALLKKNIQISIFIYGQNEELRFTEENLTLYLIKQKNYKYGGFYLYRKYLNKKINHIISSNDIDLLEVPDWTGISAFMKFKIPVVIRFHGSDTYFCHLEKRKQKWKNRFFETTAVRGANAWIAPTTFAGELSGQLFKIPNSEICTIHYGLNLEEFNNTNSDVFDEGSLLYLGTIIRKKGVFELPEIFRRVKEQCPNAKLLLIGSDAPDKITGTKSTWELLSKNFDTASKDSVKYLGEMPYSNVKHWLSKAHVCIFPSYAETLGMVTIEAMALKKAVVNTSIGWAQELIEHGVNGMLAHPSDHENFAKSIVKFLQDCEYSRRVGERARDKVEHCFNVEHIVLENIRFYKSVLTLTKS